jgi:hypothetical protein
MEPREVAVKVDAYDRSPHPTATTGDDRSEPQTAADQHRDVSQITVTNPSPDKRDRGSSPWRRTISPGHWFVASPNCRDL